MDVTLYWKAGGPTASPLKVTVQLLDSANHLVAQDDTEPGGGLAPSTSWLAGEVITSAHHLDLAKTPSGTYHLIAALYDATTGARVATAGGDTVTLTTVVVP